MLVVCMDGTMVGLRGNGPQIFFLNYYIYNCYFLQFCFIKLYFYPFKNIIDSFKSIVKVTNFSITILQTVKIAKFLLVRI